MYISILKLSVAATTCKKWCIPNQPKREYQPFSAYFSDCPTRVEHQKNHQSFKKKFMKKNGLFNLQEQKAYPIFANAAETQTPFCRPDDTRRLLQKSFSTYPPTTQTYSINTNFSKLWELSNKESWEASQAE